MTIKENLIRAITHDHPDHVPYYNEGGIEHICYTGALPPEDGLDMWGVAWQKTAGGFLPYPVRHPIQHVHELRSYPFPHLHQTELFDQATSQAINIKKKTRLIVGCHYTALFERYQTLCGMENALLWMVSHPEDVKGFLGRLAEWQIEIAKSYIHLGVEAGRISDDYGSQQNLLISPHLWRRLIKPELSRIINCYKQAGCLVFLHSCGRIMSIMDDLVEIGIDVFNIQTGTNDLEAIKQKYGKHITLRGGVDTQRIMTQGSPKIVKEAVIRAIKTLGSDGGLLLEPDQKIQMPEENIEVLVQTAKEYGSYSL